MSKLKEKAKKKYTYTFDIDGKKYTHAFDEKPLRPETKERFRNMIRRDLIIKKEKD